MSQRSPGGDGPAGSGEQLAAGPFGLWPSPLAPADLAATRRLRDVAWDTDGQTLVWLENRGTDGVLVAQRGHDAPRDLNAARPARAQVGYGGGDFTVSHGRAYWVDASDGRLCVQSLDHGRPAPLTPAFGKAAAPAVSPDGRWLVYVHSAEDADSLAIVDAAGRQWPQKLAGGAGFYMQPVWHPRGRRLAWIEWDPPCMPWDGARLMLADLSFPAGGGLPRVRHLQQVAGDRDAAVFQPAFTPDGRGLVFAADDGDWSRLHLLELDNGHRRCLTPGPHDVGLPAWLQGMRVFALAPAGDRLYFTRAEGGARRLFTCGLADGRVDPVAPLAGYSWVEQPAAAPRGTALAAIASAFDTPPQVVTLARGRVRVRARASGVTPAPGRLAQPQALSWPAADGTLVHGLYYPPTHAGGPAAGRAPLIVAVHGGPTAQAGTGYDAGTQFFATRGYAVLQVNHRGSSGYGSAYVRALRGNWGVADVEDAVSGARYLVDKGRADAGRLVIMGGSAGGYTVLRALTVHPGLFRAGVCLYGICDLFALARETHRFEAHYLDALIGPLPAASGLYRARSPLFAADRLQDPIAIFQGSDDRVVPPSQAEQIVASLRARHVPHEYHVFSGEGHGWRQPATVEAFYLAVERFLRRYVLFA